MRRSVLAAAALLAVVSACAHPSPPVSPAAAAPAGPSPVERLAAADGLLRAGCLDCLLDAYRDYESLVTGPTAEAASAGVVRAAALVALRERELGMPDEGYLDRAQRAVAPFGAPLSADATALEAIDSAAPRSGDDSRAGASPLSASDRARLLERLRAHADETPLSAAAWVVFSCVNNPDRTERKPEALLAPVAHYQDTPLLQYEAAVCTTSDDKVLEGLETANPRFVDVEYPLAVRDVAARQLDSAETRLTKALAWRPEWPSALMRLGNILMTGEDFAGALGLYERALALVPQNARAMVGRIQALSFLLRHEEAIARATELLATPNLPGDAYYWRAWNENQLERLDDAWADVEQAQRLWKNSDVRMLAGLVAYKRQELDVAKSRFTAVLEIEPARCDALFYLASVHTDLSVWPDAVSGFTASAQCFETTRRQLAAEIDRLQRSGGRPDRVARQVASREAQRANALGLQRQSWFNGAVANLRLGRKEEARQLAELLLDDEQFGARARQIVAAAR